MCLAIAIAYHAGITIAYPTGITIAYPTGISKAYPTGITIALATRGLAADVRSFTLAVLILCAGSPSLWNGSSIIYTVCCLQLCTHIC